MKGLGVRLAVVLAAVAAIGLSLADVAFVLWAQRASAVERAARLRAVAAEAALAVSAQGPAVLAELANREGIGLTLVGVDGRALAAAPAGGAAVPGGAPRPTVQIVDGAAQVSVELTHPTWARIVAHEPARASVDRVLALNRAALPLLLAMAAAMVLLGLVFLRRTVLGPMRRLTGLASAQDTDALRSFGDLSDDSFRQLSRAIIGMNQRIADDRQQLAQQVGELTSAHLEVRATQEQLVRAARLAVVGQLAAGLAHEIGNPLAVIQGFVEVIRPRPGAAAPAEDPGPAFDRIEKELARIQKTVRDLLDFSRASEAAAGHGDVAEALAHVGALLAPQSRLRQVQLVIGGAAGALPVALTTDAVTQVLLNLALNAADAVGGKGRVHIQAAAAADGRVNITVDDDGPGVPPDQRRRIFEPFYTTKPAGQGTGLGLSVCERIVSAAGGDLQVSDSPLGGARFSVTLPGVGA